MMAPPLHVLQLHLLRAPRQKPNLREQSQDEISQEEQEGAAREAGAPGAEEGLLSTCICSSCASASTTVGATTKTALDRAFFSACHAFFAAERLEGGMPFRRGISRVYLPPEDAIDMRSRAAGDVGERLVTWQRAARAAFASASRQRSRPTLPHSASLYAGSAMPEELCADAEARTEQRCVVAGGRNALSERSPM